MHTKSYLTFSRTVATYVATHETIRTPLRNEPSYNHIALRYLAISHTMNHRTTVLISSSYQGITPFTTMHIIKHEESVVQVTSHIT